MGAKALVQFEKALMLAKFLGNRVQERRAVRGLAAASRIQVRRQSRTHARPLLFIWPLEQPSSTRRAALCHGASCTLDQFVSVVAEDQARRDNTGLAFLQGQYPAAISHLKQVLKISEEMRDHVGDADAYGTIADIYTDMGDFDAAATCALSPGSRASNCVLSNCVLA